MTNLKARRPKNWHPSAIYKLGGRWAVASCAVVNGCRWVSISPLAFAANADELCAALERDQKQPGQNLGLVNWDEFDRARSVAAGFGVKSLNLTGAGVRTITVKPLPDGSLVAHDVSPGISPKSRAGRLHSFPPGDFAGVVRFAIAAVEGEAPTPEELLIPYKTGWLAVRGASQRALAKATGASLLRSCSLGEALAALQREPDAVAMLQLDEWTLAISDRFLGEGTGDSLEELAARVLALSVEFGEAQAFGSHRTSDAAHWMKARDGKLIRLSAFADGEMLLSSGRRDAEERAVWDGKSAPSEETVFKIAARWGANPRGPVPRSTDVRLGRLQTLSKASRKGT